MVSQEKELAGKVALITGAGSGIGKAAALLMARKGARVAALGRSEKELQETVEQIGRDGGEAVALLADISDAARMQAVYQELESRYGALHIVFANAGVNGVWTPIEELEPEEWDKTININLRGTFLTVKYAIPLLKRNGGSIIITASVNGTRIFSNTGATAYSTTKAGQVAFTQMAALELAKHRIRVNVICPGAITTRIDENTEKRDLESEREPVEFPEGKIPLTDGQPGSSEQVAELVLFLASDRASHITGTPIWIDGAESLLMG
ncbi:SDR family oxidoreductase [Larkinella soli]|uniref:SDR family oxidoreductase n=1 Tax=Larkinella soli TaxID=1770527 RepID=UPI000FFC14D5|nr:SDR family NAD(P)-dependent oxidoreductase [Larkinella soli]